MNYCSRACTPDSETLSRHRKLLSILHIELCTYIYNSARSVVPFKLPVIFITIPVMIIIPIHIIRIHHIIRTFIPQVIRHRPGMIITPCIFSMNSSSAPSILYSPFIALERSAIISMMPSLSNTRPEASVKATSVLWVWIRRHGASWSRLSTSPILRSAAATTWVVPVVSKVAVAVGETVQGPHDDFLVV